MASSITPTPPMPADWTPYGACTRGSTVPPKGATRRESGGDATTNTRRVERSHGRSCAIASVEKQVFRAGVLWRLGAALRRQRGGNNRLVRVHVGDGRDGDAGRLD